MPIITRNGETPPLTIGPRRFHYFYSTILPQIHLILVSVLHSIAFGVLLLGIPLPPDITHLPSIEFLLQHYFYLPYVVSSLPILIIWINFALACMFSLWPLSVLQSGLIYLIALAEILSFRLISAPGTKLSAWLISFGLIAIIGGCIRLNNTRLECKEDYESMDFGEVSIKGERNIGILYVGLDIVLVTFGLVYDQLTDMLKRLV